MNNIISKRTKVIVGGSVFEIPSEKVNELLGLLARWQSISISEEINNPQQTKWNGQSLIYG